MSSENVIDLMTLHLPPTTGATRQVRHRMYDFCWYPQWNMAIAFIGHEPVALYDAVADELVPSEALRTEFMEWARARRPPRDDDTVTLTERGRVEANLLHAVRLGGGDPTMAGAGYAAQRIAEMGAGNGASDTV